MHYVDSKLEQLNGVTQQSTARVLAEKGAAAAAYVRKHATCPEDEALLLDMLGLSVGEDSAAA